MGREQLREVAIHGSVLNPYGDSNILLFDDFEGRQNWTGSGTGADWTVAQSTGGNEMIDGMYGLKMAASVLVPSYVNALRYTRYSVGPMLSFQVAFRPTTIATSSNFYVYVLVYTGSRVYYYTCTYYFVLQAWYYYAVDNVFRAIPGASQRLFDGAWNRLTFVIDVSKFTLEEFECNGLLLLNLGLACHNVANTTDPCCMILFQIDGSVSPPATVYIDNVLFSQV